MVIDIIISAVICALIFLSADKINKKQTKKFNSLNDLRDEQ